MGVMKHEFYEGAAVLRLIKASRGLSVRHEAPFLVFERDLAVYLKYNARGRSPWGFAFSSEELASVRSRGAASPVFVALVCGSDGVVLLQEREVSILLGDGEAGGRIGCARSHGGHYHVSGPEGSLPSKIPPGRWTRLLSVGAEG